MCLRTWLEHLKDDPDLWADTYLFEYDKWVAEKMVEPLSIQYGGLTSFELMIVVFGVRGLSQPEKNTWWQQGWIPGASRRRKAI